MEIEEAFKTGPAAIKLDDLDIIEKIGPVV